MAVSASKARRTAKYKSHPDNYEMVTRTDEEPDPCLEIQAAQNAFPLYDMNNVQLTDYAHYRITAPLGLLSTG